eukprot:6189926-Pleurochrysis_carterae.AAC.2
MKVVGGGGVRGVKGDGHAFGKVRFNQVVDVLGLGELDATVANGDVNVEQIRYRAIVFHVPPVREGIGEVIVEGAVVVVKIQGEEVAHVKAEDEALQKT